MAHYLAFASKMDLPDPCGSGIGYAYAVAIYARTLIGGDNLYNKTIRAKTVENYLHAVNQLFIVRGFERPFIPTNNTNPSTKLLECHKSWEKQPNRREAISKE